MEQLMNADDLVSLTKWSRETIYQKARRGEIPGCIKLGKRSLRFQKSKIDQWINPQNTKAIKEK